MTKRVLMIAYHFPPLAGSSGIQRSLRFVQHLPEFGWEPLVLTVKESAYERKAIDLQKDVASATIVKRSFAFDAARQFAFNGSYVAALARPDRWMSWRWFGVRDGMRLIREHKPHAIWSTYPIPTAHVIGAELQARSGLPWIADFRDPMAQDTYPSDPITRESFRRIEALTAQRASLMTLTTPSAVRDYQQRYPSAATRIQLLENGYDESSFANLPVDVQPLNPGLLTLLHSGIVYPSERDPSKLIEALSLMRMRGQLGLNELRLRFRAAVHDKLIAQLADQHGVRDCIEIMPPVDYKDALAEMLRADGLLVLQASNCNAQVPAKIYEYLRTGKPILGLTDAAGDTAAVMRAAGVGSIFSLDSAEDIAQGLARFMQDLRAKRTSLPHEDYVRQASRRGRTALLAQLLDSLT